MEIPTITALELEELRVRGKPFELIDVRTPGEFREVHAEHARLVPLGALDPEAFMRTRSGATGEPFYVICRSGGRSRQAVARFRAAGYTNAVSVEGGTIAWEQAGLPVVRGAKKLISLERQVRIAAGSLVVFGTACGAFIHPAFLGLAAFVGAGLVFAGVTDTCGMGLLLARMPWNQGAAGSEACTTSARDKS
jgi:rhodanese-related sulfurtransferase